MKRLLLLFALLPMAASPLLAQEYVYVEGTVSNLHTGRPCPDYLVHLAQGGVQKVLRMTDSAGRFSIDSLPAGTWQLLVSTGIATLYRAEVDIPVNAHLSLLIDTIATTHLRPVAVNARRPLPPLPKHKLGDRLITSPDDPRLGAAGFDEVRDNSASEASPPEMHPLYEDGQYTPVVLATTEPASAIRFRSQLLTSEGYLYLPFYERERIYRHTTRQVNAVVLAYWYGTYLYARYATPSQQQ